MKRKIFAFFLLTLFHFLWVPVKYTNLYNCVLKQEM